MSPIAPDHQFPHWEKDEVISWDCPEGGYADRQSVAPGEEIQFHISTSRRDQEILIYREGHQRRQVASIPASNLELQSVNPDQPYANGFGWQPSVRFTIPADWPSGVYVAQFLTGLGVRELIFIVRPATPGAPILWVLADNTYQAYTVTGGKSCYGYHSTDQAYSSRLSFDRPHPLDGTGSFLICDQPLLAWLEREGIEADLCSQVDVAMNPAILNDYKLMMRNGHDEYWANEELQAVYDFINNGGNAVFFSGNNIWWQIRYEQNGRQMVVHKDPRSWPAGMTEADCRDPIVAVDPEAETTNYHLLPGNKPDRAREIIGCWRTGMVNYYWKPSDEEIWPGAARVGGRLLGPEDGHGGYTVQRPEHWAFEGSGLKKDDVLGRDETICGTEVDGLDIDWRDDLPWPSGKDGVPLDWEILATSKIAYVHDYEFGEGGMVCREGRDGRGTVFNAATIDWAHGLETSDPVRRITRNVIDRLSG